MSQVHPMLEKVVKATSNWLLEKDGDSYRVTHGCVVYGSLHGLRSEALKELETRRARAAVRALMEPDEGMKEAGVTKMVGAVEEDWTVDAREIFRAMLLPLLAEERQPTPGVYEPQHRRVARMGEG